MRNLVLGAIIFCAISLVWVSPAQAQRHKDAVKIVVTASPSDCFYRVETDGMLAANQDTIFVKPNARVEIEMIETDGRAVVGDDTREAVTNELGVSKVVGTDGSKKAKVKRGAKGELRARKNKGLKTKHEMTITCCDSFGFLGLGCSNPRVAGPGESPDMGSVIQLDPQAEFTRGPAFDDDYIAGPVRSPKGGGGPVMEVDP